MRSALSSSVLMIMIKDDGRAVDARHRLIRAEFIAAHVPRGDPGSPMFDDRDTFEPDRPVIEARLTRVAVRRRLIVLEARRLPVSQNTPCRRVVPEGVELYAESSGALAVVEFSRIVVRHYRDRFCP